MLTECHVAEVLKEGTDGSEDMSTEIIYCVGYFLSVLIISKKNKNNSRSLHSCHGLN